MTVTVTALIAWGREYKRDRVNLNEVDVILSHFDTLLLILTLFDTLTCSKFQERVLFNTNKSAAPEASRKAFKRNPAGFRPDPGRNPAEKSQ